MNDSHMISSRIRKGRWSEEECMRFERAYLEHGCNWKAITTAVGSRTIIQVRSHGQKVLPSLIKDGPKYITKSQSDIEVSLNQEQATPVRNQTSLYDAWLYHTLAASHFFTAMKGERGNDMLNDDANRYQDEVGAFSDDGNEEIA